MASSFSAAQPLPPAVAGSATGSAPSSPSSPNSNLDATIAGYEGVITRLTQQVASQQSQIEELKAMLMAQINSSTPRPAAGGIQMMGPAGGEGERQQNAPQQQAPLPGSNTEANAGGASFDHQQQQRHAKQQKRPTAAHPMGSFALHHSSASAAAKHTSSSRRRWYDDNDSDDDSDYAGGEDATTYTDLSGGGGGGGAPHGNTTFLSSSSPAAPASHSPSASASPSAWFCLSTREESVHWHTLVEEMVRASLARHMQRVDESIARAMADRVRRVTREHVINSVEREFKRMRRQSLYDDEHPFHLQQQQQASSRSPSGAAGRGGGGDAEASGQWARRRGSANGDMGSGGVVGGASPIYRGGGDGMGRYGSAADPSSLYWGSPPHPNSLHGSGSLPRGREGRGKGRGSHDDTTSIAVDHYGTRSDPNGYMYHRRDGGGAAGGPSVPPPVAVGAAPSTAAASAAKGATRESVHAQSLRVVNDIQRLKALLTSIDTTTASSSAAAAAAVGGGGPFNSQPPAAKRGEEEEAPSAVEESVQHCYHDANNDSHLVGVGGGGEAHGQSHHQNNSANTDGEQQHARSLRSAPRPYGKESGVLHRRSHTNNTNNAQNNNTSTLSTTSSQQQQLFPKDSAARALADRLVAKAQRLKRRGLGGGGFDAAEGGDGQRDPSLSYHPYPSVSVAAAMRAVGNTSSSSSPRAVAGTHGADYGYGYGYGVPPPAAADGADGPERYPLSQRYGYTHPRFEARADAGRAAAMRSAEAMQSSANTTMHTHQTSDPHNQSRYHNNSSNTNNNSGHAYHRGGDRHRHDGGGWAPADTTDAAVRPKSAKYRPRGDGDEYGGDHHDRSSFAVHGHNHQHQRYTDPHHYHNNYPSRQPHDGSNANTSGASATRPLTTAANGGSQYVVGAISPEKAAAVSSIHTRYGHARPSTHHYDPHSGGAGRGAPAGGIGGMGMGWANLGEEGDDDDCANSSDEDYEPLSSGGDEAMRRMR